MFPCFIRVSSVADSLPKITDFGLAKRLDSPTGLASGKSSATLRSGEVVGTPSYMAPAQAAHLIDRAYRIALTARTVTAIIVPEDVQEAEHQDPPRTHGVVYTGGGITMPRIVPQEKELRRAADVLNEGQKVAMLIGQGAKGAAEEVKEVADILGCGIAKALNGRSALPDDLPYVTGSIGLLGTKPSNDMIENCDTFLMVGSSFPYSEWLPEPGQARGVQIDIDGKMIGIRYTMEVNLVGDAKETLRALIPRLKRKEDRSWRQEIEDNVRRWWEILENRAMEGADPLNPQRVFWELSLRLPERCIVTADSGSATNWWARQLKLRKGMKAALLVSLAPGSKLETITKALVEAGASVRSTALVGSHATRYTVPAGKGT